MKKSALFLLIFFAINSILLFGQETPPDYFAKPPACLTDFFHKKILEENNIYREKEKQLEKAAYQAAVSGEKLFLNYTLPVVVHIIHDNGNENISDALVLQGIQDLNDAFANAGYYDQGTGVNTNIQFCLTKRAPDGTATTGINRVQSSLTEMTSAQDLDLKDLIRWDPLHYINIWLVREICAGSNCAVAGYAYFPTLHGQPKDGIVMEANFFGSSKGGSGVQIHEMGHYLGLYHTFQGGCANNDCMADGDRVCDTPPDQSTTPVPCGGSANSCSTDTDSGFTSDEDDMYWNYMDYGDFDCYSAFTQGQADRMAFFIDFQRFSLLDSKACEDPCPVSTVMSIDPVSSPVDIGSTVVFTLTAPALTDFEWFVDGVPAGTGASFSYTFNNEGFYEISVEGGTGSLLCQAFDMTHVSVTCPVDASFTASSLNIFLDETVTFTSTLTNSTSHEWYLDGMQVSTANGFSETFPNEGFYSVQLIASNGICSDTTDLTYVIVSNPCSGSGAKQISTGSQKPVQIRKLDDGGLLVIFSISLSDHTIVRFDADQQVVWAKQVDVDGLYADDVVEDLVNGDLLFCGHIAGQGTSDGVIFKLDANGDYIWGLRTVQPSMFLDNIEAAPGGGFLISGSSNDSTRLVKFLTDGTILWAKRYQGVWGENFKPLSDGSIFVSGFAPFNLGLSLCGVGKLDGNGVPIWAYRYHDSSNPYNSISGHYRPLEVNDENGVVITAVAEYVGGTKSDVLLSVDAMGDIIWAKDYDHYYNVNNFATQPISAIKRTPDGGYVFYSNRTTDMNASLVKVSSSGEFFWSHNYTTDYNFPTRSPRIEILDNGNMVVGHTRRLFITDQNGNLGNCPVNLLPAESNDILVTADPIPFTEIGSFSFEPVAATSFSVQFSPNTTCESQSALLPDAELTALDATFCNDVYTLNWEVCNTGTDAIPMGTPYTFYEGNPTESAAPVLLGETLDADLLPNECGTLQITLPLLPGTPVYCIFNDDGSTSTPFDLVVDLPTATSLLECNFVNNMDSLSLADLPNTTPIVFLGNDTTLCANQSLLLDPGSFNSYLWNNTSTSPTLTVSTSSTYSVTVTDACGEKSADTIEVQIFTPPTLNLGPDVFVCENAVVPLDAGSGFTSYSWSDASTEQTLTAWLPDTYSVTVTDACGGTQTDDITITFDPTSSLDLPDTLTACEGEPLSISATGYLEYQWLPSGILDCDNCPVVNFTADVDQVFHLLVKTADGCFSSDSVAVIVSDVIQTFEEMSLCEGETVVIFGTNVNTPGTYSESFSSANGCDSIHSIQLTLQDSFVMESSLLFCEGDSILVFGEWVNTPGVYEEVFTAINGCDSTHSITVSEIPTEITSEIQTICTGDSLLIFGNWETTAAIYSNTFTAINGCDSTHVIELRVENTLTSFEEINICEGDSILVFGNWESTAGFFSEIYTSSFGCDSTASIELSVMPAPASNEQIQICPDDSVFVAGQWVDEGGIFTESFPNNNGCDSSHIIEVVVEEDILLNFDLPFIVAKGISKQLEIQVLSDHQNLQYDWFPSAGLSCADCLSPFANPDETTTYYLTVTDELGCSVTYQLVINVTVNESVFLPTVFSPNNDQVNDELFPQGVEGGATVRHLMVFDRWGDMVFENKDLELNNPVQGWDGNFRGKKAPAGVYATVMELEWASGRMETIRNGLILLR